MCAVFFCFAPFPAPNQILTRNNLKVIMSRLPICSVPILSAVAHKSSVHLRPNRFHSRLFYCTCRNFEGEGVVITECWSQKGEERERVLDTEKIQTIVLVSISDCSGSSVSFSYAVTFLTRGTQKEHYDIFSCSSFAYNNSFMCHYEIVFDSSRGFY